MTESFQIEWGGKNLIIETGRLANQANGSCTVRYGDTVVLATATMAETTREGVDFLPLSVEYEERLYAAGKIKGSRFIKREGRPTDEAILTGRLIDRSIRPLFDDHIRQDIQVVTTVFSVDGENDSDVPALIGAAAALMISDIPWQGSLAGARVGLIDGEWVLNPTFAAREKSDLDLVVAGDTEKVLMLEANANEISEEKMQEAIAFGQKHLRSVLALLEEVKNKVGRTKKVLPLPPANDEEMKDKEEKKQAAGDTEKIVAEKMEEFFQEPQATKGERGAMIGKIEKVVEERLGTLNFSKEKRKFGAGLAAEIVEKIISQEIIKSGRRIDGRGLEDVRAIKAEVGIMPRTHGSALFSRGETQILSCVTLGAPSMEQTLEGMEVSGKKRYFHHYNFPPYSVGETGRMFGPGRREVGHGALAERAIWPLLPNKEEFPYTIRVVSEVLSSNGSSSMASTCASSQALMDAGVPLKKAVAGVAIGLASDEENNEWRVFTDLQDLEDAKGGMDFKVAGTKDGITVMQMDTKTRGLSKEIVAAALAAAKLGREKIMVVMDSALAAPRPELSQYAPRIISFHINPDKIRDVIGPGGKMINEIIDKTGVQIDIEDDGLVMITAVSTEAGEKAAEWIRNLTREVKAGEIFEGKVTRLLDFGAFVEILPKQEGLVHISELAVQRVENVSDVVQIGDTVKVKVIKIDDLGRINLSMRALLPGGERSPSEDREARPRQDRPHYGHGSNRPSGHSR